MNYKKGITNRCAYCLEQIYHSCNNSNCYTYRLGTFTYLSDTYWLVPAAVTRLEILCLPDIAHLYKYIERINLYEFQGNDW